MELELGLKVTRTREDVSSSVDFRFSKDPFGPLVLSRETDSRFIIIIHLRGFKREGVEIDINKEGDRITIRGRKPVEEMVMIRWMAWRKEVEMRAFRKVFLIPDVVDLDKIKARFDDEDATLTITMPKRVKGISGFNLEQEEEGVDVGDVSEVENREEVEEEYEEREECDEHSEVQGEEDFGEMVEDEEREIQVYEGGEEGFSGGVDETQIEDDDLEEIQQELADSDRESDDNVLKKFLHIMEQEDNQEVMDQKVSEETKSGDIRSGAGEEIEEQESDEASGLEELPEIIEQEDNQEVMEQKVSGEIRSGDSGSGAVVETEESDEDNGLKELPDMIEQEDNQEVMEQKVSGEIEEEDADEDSGLEKLADIMEQEDNQESMKKKVSEQTKTDEIGSGAVKEIEEEESNEDSGLKELPDMIEQEDNQEVMEQKVSEESKSEGTGSGAVEEIEEQESSEDSGLKNLPDIMEHKVSEDTRREDSGSGAVEEIEEQESNEIGGTSKRREMEKKKTDGGDDDGLRKAQGTEEPKRHNEESKIQEMVEEKTVGQHEFADSNTESEETRSLRKLPDILEQENNNQDVMEQKESQEENRSDELGSRAFQEIEKQEPYEQLDDETSKTRAKADDDGLNKVQGNEEQERRNEVIKIQEMGEGFTPHTERTPVVAEYDVAETKTKAEELESEKSEEDKVDKKNELVEKKEEEDDKVRRESEDRRSLTKLEENEEKHSKVPKRQDKPDIKELVEEKALKAETDIVNDVPKPVQETEAPENDTVVKTDDEGKEKKKSVKMETAPNIAENETKPEDFESEKLREDEVDKIHKPVEKKVEEERSLVKLQENEEQHYKGRKRQDKQEDVKELVEEEALEAETNIVNDFPKLVQENEVPEVGTLGEVVEQKVSEETKSDNIGSGALEEIEEHESDEDSDLEKLPDIIEKVMEQRVSEETKSGDTGFGAVEEMEEQESDEVGGTSKSRAMEKQGTGGDDGAGLRKAHGTKEPERHNEESNGKEAQTEVEDLDKSQQIDEQGKTLEYGEENNVGQQEFADSVTESEDSSSLRKPPDILEQGNNQDEKDSQEESKRGDMVSEAFEYTEKQEPCEQLDGTSKSREMADDDGLIKTQGIEEPERRNEVSRIQEMVEGETSDHEKRSVKVKTSMDQKEEVGADTGKGFTPNIERTPAVAETETKAEELASIKPEADKVEKKHELVEKKEEEEDNSKVRRRESEDRRSLIKLQENEEHHSKGRKGQENIKELVEEKAPEAETDKENDTLKPVQDTEGPEVGTVVKTDEERKEGKEKKKSVKVESINMGEGFAPNTTETETKPEDFVSEKQGAAEVEKKEQEDANVRAKGEDSILTKLQENEEQYSKGRKQQDKQETIKELVEEKAPEAETNIVNDVPKPVQETEVPELVGKLGETGDEGKHEKEKKIVANIAESETKPEEFVPDQLKADEVDKIYELVEKKKEEEENGKAQSEDISSIKPQEVREEQSQGQKIEELVEEQTPEEETNISNDNLKPVQERGEGKQTAPNIAETEAKPEDTESNKVEAGEVYKIHKLVEKKEEEGENNAEVRTQSEDISSTKPQEVGEQQSQGQKRHEKHEEIKEFVEEKTPEADTTTGNDTPKPVQERCEGTNDTDSRKTQESIRQQELDKCEKESKTHELVESKTNDEETETEGQDSYRPKVLGEEERVKELAEEKPHFSKNGKVKWEEEIPEKKAELGYDEISRKAGDSHEKEEVDVEMGKRFTPSVAETETKPEDFESEKVGADEVDKIQKLVEKKEEEDGNVRRKSEDSSLTKLQENEESHSKGRKQQRKHETIKELLEETNIVNDDVSKPVQETEVPELGGTLGETGDEGKHEKEKKVVANIAESDTKPEEFVPDQLKADEVDELVEKKKEEEENAKAQSEDISSIKPQEVREEQSQQGQKQEKIEELVEKQTPEEETYISNDTLQQKIQKLLEEEAKKHPEEHKEQMAETEKKFNAASTREVQDLDEESKTLEVVKSKTNDEESYRPKILREEEIAEKKTEEFGDDEVDKIHKPVEKKREEDPNVRRKSEDRSLIKLQEGKEPHSKGRKQQEKQENTKELVEEKAPEVETNVANDIPKPVHEIEPEVGTLGETDDTEKEPKEKKKSVSLEVPVVIAETETKPEEFETDQLKSDEVDKIHELVEKTKEEEEEKNAKAGTESEDISLIKPQEIGEQQFQGRKQHHNQEKIDELVEEKTPEEETNDTLKPVQERYEGKKKIQKNVQEEAKKQPVEHKEKMVETEKFFNSAGSRDVQDLDGAERCEKESKILEVVKSETSDEEKEEKDIEETQESYRPKILWELEEIEQKKTEEFGDDDDHQISRRGSDSKEEVDVEMGKVFKPNISETETKGEEFESQKLEPDVNEDIHDVVEKNEDEEKNAKVRRQREGRRSLIELQENERQHSKRQKRQEKTAEETETSIPTPVQETGNEGKEEKKKSVTMEIKNGYPKEESDAKNGKGFAPNTAETETKAEEFESDELESDEVDELVEKKEEEEEDNAKARMQNEDSNFSAKLQETKEQQQDKLKELVEEKTPAAAVEIEEPEETMEQESHRPNVFGDDDLHVSKRDSNAKEEGKGITSNISETEKKAEEFESDTVKAIEEEDRIHELVEKKKKEENATGRKKSEDSSLKRLQEEKFQGPHRHSKQEKMKELVEEKQEAETAKETEKTKVEGLEICEEKVFSETETKDQESYRPKILEGEDKIQEKTNGSRKVEEEEDTAEKKTELGDDDMSRKAGEIDAMKGQEEKEKIKELALEEKVSDGANKIVADVLVENDKSRKAQKIYEQKSHEEEKRGEQVQELVGGETSGQGEVDDVESEKKTTEVDKRFREAQEIERTDSDVSGKYVKEEEEDGADILERGTKIEQELVHLNSQMEQVPGENTQELVDEEMNKGKEEESETTTDDVIRKVQGMKEHELFEPENYHSSKNKEVMEEKTLESEIEAERGGLSNVHGSEEEESHEPNIHKESYKTNITGTEEPSGQEEEEKEKTVEYMTIKEIKDQRSDKESNEKQYKIQELVEGGHNDDKEEQKYENMTVKAKQETEEETSKGVQETERQESDGLSTSLVQDKKQEIEKKEINRAEERKTKTEDVSLRKVQDDEDSEMSKTYKRLEEDKIQEPLEMGKSGYKERVKKQDGVDISRSQEPGKPNSDELERHGERDDKIDEPLEVWTHDDREKDKKQDGDDVSQSVEDDSSDKFHEFEERKLYEDWTRETQEKSKEEETGPKESEEKEKTRAVEENEVVERRTRTRDGSLRKAQDDSEPELSKPYKPQEEDKVQESVERGTSDNKEELKKQDGNDTSRNKELGKPNLVTEEATAKAGHSDHKEEQNEEKVITKAQLKAEEYNSTKDQEIENQKSDELQRSLVQDKMQETGEKEETKAIKENDTVERRTKTSNVSLTKVQDDAGPELSKEEDKVHESVERGTSDYREKVKKQDGNDTTRSKELGKHTYEAGHKEEQEEENVIAEEELRAEESTLKKVQEIEKQKPDKLQRSLVHDKMQETEEKEKTRTIEDNEIVERRTKTEDSSLREFQDGKESESSKPYKRRDEDKIKELVEMKTSDYGEKVKTQDGDDILRSQETEKLNLVEEEATGPKDKHTGAKEEPEEEERYEKVAQTETKVEDENQKEDDSMRKTQESEKEESQEPDIHETLHIVQDYVAEETRDQEDEAAAVEANYDEDSSRTTKEHEERKEQRNDPQDEERIADKETTEKEAYEDWTQEERGMMKDLVREEALDLKHTCGEGHNEHKEEQHEEKFIPKAEVKAEEDSSEQEFDELQRSLGQDKMQETEEKRKPRSVEENKTVEGKTETEDGSLRKVQEGEDPELSRHKRHEEELKKEDEDDILRSQETSKVVLGEEDEKEESEELDIVQDFVEDKTWDQEDDRVGEAEAEAVLGNNEKDSSRKLLTTGGEELKEHEEQDEIPATSDPRVEEKDGERVAEKERHKMEKVHVQEPEGKTENEESRRGQKGKQEKNDETRSDDGIIRKVRETKVQESDEKNDQEPGGKIEEPERKEASNDGVKLETEEDSLIKGQEFIEKESSKTRPLGQENMQQLMDAEKQEDEGKSEAGEEIQAKIREEKGIEGSEKVAEVEKQAKIGIILKDQETKRQELYELQENEEHDKIPEPIVEGTNYQREEEKRVEDREAEDNEDVSSRKVQKIKGEESDGLEKHRKLSELQEKQSVEEEEGYKAVLKTESMEDSRQSQDVEEKGSDQAERHAEQENNQEQMAKKKEEEQNEKEKRMPQVESKANDDSSRKNDTERWRGQEQKKDHQEVVEIETSDQRKKEREEKIPGNEVSRDECDSSRKNQEHEGEQLDKVERHGEEEMSGLLAKEETSNNKEENRGNRAGAETTIKDDGFRGKQLEIVLRHSEQDKKQLVVEKDTSGKAKDKRNQETKSEDDSSKKTIENEKQDSHEQKRNYEEQDKKKSIKTHQLIEKETGEGERLREKENRETADADGSSKKIQEIDKEGSSEPRRDEERDKIQPVDSETSEDESEELEVEVEESEEDWEAEVIREMDSDEDNDKLRKIRRIKLGFRLVGGSTLFMSLIVIVISIIRSKRKTKCYKF